MMSEDFERGLDELWADAARTHAAQTVLPTGDLVRRARRHRRARAAAVSMATAAAVAGLGLGTVAAVDWFGTDVVPPATSDPTPHTPEPGAIGPDCGVRLADLTIHTDTDLELVGVLNDTSAPGAQLRDARVWLESSGEVVSLSVVNIATDTRFVIVQDGTIVGLTRSELTAEDDEGRAAGSVRMLSCAGSAADPLPPGDYQVYALLPFTHDGEQGFLSGGPWDVTVTEEPEPDPSTEALELLDPGANRMDGDQSPTPGDPLTDGSYIAFVRGIDPAAGTIDADMAIFMTGQAAVDWLTENQPDAEIPPPNDFVIVNEVERVRTLPVADGAPIWDVCFDGDSPWLQRDIAQWAAAPELGELTCSAGPELGRAFVYWLDVHDGVVVQVVGQYIP